MSRFAVAILYLAANVAAQQQWTNFKVHFDLNPFSGYYYKTMPRQVGAGTPASEYTNISGQDCTNGGKYNGFRFLDSDGGLALLYDVQGTIAGIQQILKKSEVVPGNTFNYDAVPEFQSDNVNGVDVYVATAYFVDPSTICTTGRTSDQLQTVGTGNVLQVQSGPTPASLRLMPRNRADAIAQGWTQDKCFVGMGYHNFFQVENMSSNNCDQIVPYFGLYDNNGDQIGFGFASTGKGNSNYFEHPTSGAVKLIVGADIVPQCLLDRADSPGLSTMHVFFTDNPNLYACVL